MALQQFNNSNKIYYFDPAVVEGTHFDFINSQEFLMITMPSGNEYAFSFPNTSTAIAWIDSNLPVAVSGDVSNHNCECP